MPSNAAPNAEKALACPGPSENVAHSNRAAAAGRAVRKRARADSRSRKQMIALLWLLVTGADEQMQYRLQKSLLLVRLTLLVPLTSDKIREWEVL